MRRQTTARFILGWHTIQWDLQYFFYNAYVF